MSQFNLYLERVQENRNYQDLEVYDEGLGDIARKAALIASGIALLATLATGGKSLADTKIKNIQTQKTAGAFFSQNAVDTTTTSYGYFYQLAQKLLEGKEKIDPVELKNDLKKLGLSQNGIELVVSTTIEAQNEPNPTERYKIVQKYFSNTPLKVALSATLMARNYLDGNPKNTNDHKYAKELLIGALLRYPDWKGVTELEIKKADYEELKKYSKTMQDVYQERVDNMYGINI